MNAKLFVAASLTAFATSAQAQPADAGPALYEDAPRGTAVRAALAPGAVLFSANLPAGWGFLIDIDGDGNGAWGNGPEPDAQHRETSDDRTFAQDSRNGVFCAQYILTTRPGAPEAIYARTECSGYPSQGRVEMGQLDEHGRATITYRIPAAEVFGAHGEAHLRACVWDSRAWTCQRSLANLVVLRAPGARQ